MKIFKTIYKSGIVLAVAFCSMLLLGSCGGNKPYKIDGTIEGFGTQNVIAIYHNGTALKEMTVNAVDSKFHIEGIADAPVVVEFYNNQRYRIGCVVAENGDEINVKFKAGDPNFMEAAGNETSELLSDFLRKNSETLNDGIEKQIISDPAAALSVILAGYYYNVATDAVRADSILSLFDYTTVTDNPMLRAKAEVASRLADVNATVEPIDLFSSNDSIERFEPSTKKRTLYIFTDIHRMPDSILNYTDSLAHDIKIALIRMSVDTFGWHKDTYRFAKEVKHFWALGGTANERLNCFNIPSLPYFVVADTTARQIYRGTSLPVLPQ